MKYGLQYRYGLATVAMITMVAMVLGLLLLLEFRGSFVDFSEENRFKAEQNLRAQARQYGIIMVDMLAEQLVNPLYSMDMRGLWQVLGATWVSPDILSLKVYDIEGDIVHDGTEAIATFGDNIRDDKSIAAIQSMGSTVITETEKVLFISRSIWIGGRPLGGVRVAFSLNSINDKLLNLQEEQYRHMTDSLQMIVFKVVAITIVLVVLGIVFFLLMLRRLIKPIREVADFAREIGCHKYGRKLNYRYRDEIGDLVDSFNYMSLQLQETTVSREMAEVASRAKGEFLANMSHEIRTPLNGVLGVIDLLLQAELGDKQRQLAQVVHDSGKNLLDIVNDILDFSKIEAGKIEFESINFDLRELINGIHELFGGKAGEKEITLTCTVEDSIPRIIHADPLRLHQVFVNFISNAIKFTERGGVNMTVELLEKNDGEGLFRFAVSDTGIGLNDEEKEGIFVAFSQADSSTTRKYGGTGLGLTISRQLVGLMGGEIGVESEPGLGSNFWFTVSLLIPDDQKRAAFQYEQERHEITRRKNKHLRFNCQILVVEDNSTNRIVVEGMLKIYGCTVELAVNGQEAVRAVKEKKYDLIFMDCQMPVLDGYEATSEIRKFEDHGAKTGEIGETKNIRTPIIAVTAHAMQGDREKCLLVGMDDYLGKPIQQHQLLNILGKWLPHARQVVEELSHEDIVINETELAVMSLDPSVLEQYRLIQKPGEPDMVKKIIRSYLETVPSLLQSIKNGVTDKNHEELWQAAHTMKSSNKIIGAGIMAGICHELEVKGRAGSLYNCKQLSEELEREFSYVENQLRGFL